MEGLMVSASIDINRPYTNQPYNPLPKVLGVSSCYSAHAKKELKINAK